MPTSAATLTALLHTLSTINPPTSVPKSLPSPTTTSPLSTLTGRDLTTAKNTLLTLHFLFPHELLPALDLLDRKLVTRLTCHRQTQQPNLQPTKDITTPSTTEAEIEVFYIQSASAVSSTNSTTSSNSTGRFRNAWRRSATKTSYEVRLDSWNCSCAAFAQAQLRLILGLSAPDTATDSSPGIPAFTVEAPMAPGTVDEGRVKGEQRSQRLRVFGGVATNSGMPIPTCKHILAAAIGMAAPGLFGHGIQSREVSVEELAGWSVGWGEV